jgi:hypothetical protein
MTDGGSHPSFVIEMTHEHHFTVLRLSPFFKLEVESLLSYEEAGSLVNQSLSYRLGGGKNAATKTNTRVRHR